ncbi:MAG: sigma-70 family RNA polymerase sigma factor [Cyanobacteria bacterium SIG31]|nr:sigma-70 family RNA polymerase sigma factor [Cyanobacteria bacterium SIG31]
MKDLETINKEREGRINLSQHKELIETISKVEYKKFSNLGLIDLSEVINLATYTVYYLVNNSVNKELYNEAYLTKAIKWAIRNEMRRRYKWHTMKNQDPEQEKVKDAVYKTILSIEEMAEAENPTIIKDTSRTPEEKAEILELKKRIQEVMKRLPQREQDLIEAKYFYDKKLKDISAEFNISQSRISRIIQNALDKIKKELLKQEQIDENNI